MKIDKTLVGPLLRSGLSYSAIAERLGVSRQSIHTTAVTCYPVLAEARRRQRSLSLELHREKKRREHFMRVELPWLVKEWLFEAGYSRCMTCGEYKALDLFPPSVTPYRGSVCNPCNAGRMKEWRTRVPVEQRNPGGWRALTPEQREERVRVNRERRWGA